MLAGLIIQNRFFGPRAAKIDFAFHVPMSFGMYVAIHAIRSITLLVFSPLLTEMGYGVSKKEGILMVYAGLRGAVSLAMALLADMDPNIHLEEKNVVRAGVCCLLYVTRLEQSTASRFIFPFSSAYLTLRYQCCRSFFMLRWLSR
eukprot:COSAG05_NODE_31_length_28416_cov_170.150652_19_plen_145_part_00